MSIPHNPKRTGGPRSAVGMHAVVYNAVKTGAYAIQVVLPGEDASQFADLEAQLMKDFEPVGMAEGTMVHDLAVLTWRRLRVDRVERSGMVQTVQDPFPDGKLAQSYGAGFLKSALPRLDPYCPASEDEFDESTQKAAQLQALQAALSCTVAVVRRKWPLAFAALVHWSDCYNIVVGDLIEGSADCAYELEDAIQELLSDAETVTWLWQNREAVDAAVSRARDARLWTFMQRNNTQRINDDISRAFFRTLSELRKQQDWRRRRTAIVLDDAVPKASATSPGMVEQVQCADQTSSHLDDLLK